jgi:serine protease
MEKVTAGLAVLVLLAAVSPAAGLTPNDPLYPHQWNLRQIQAPDAWDHNQGSRRVKVAVVDTGVAYEDFEQFVLVSDLAETFFDRENAYDFVHHDAHPNDASGHGTHVTGTLAQSTNNGHGAAGVAPGVTVLPLQAFRADNTASVEAVVQALHYAVDQGVDIINFSAGAASDDPAVRQACRRAYEAGILVVAAVGNRGLTLFDYPSAYPTVLAVGAVIADGTRAYYSNYGPDMIMAPGGTLLQDQDGDGYPDGVLQQWKDGSFRFETGTSMATPHVAGVAALVLSEAMALGLELPTGPDRVEWLRWVLISSAQDLGPAGQDAEYGYGLVCADAALATLFPRVQTSASPKGPGGLDPLASPPASAGAGAVASEPAPREP